MFRKERKPGRFSILGLSQVPFLSVPTIALKFLMRQIQRRKTQATAHSELRQKSHYKFFLRTAEKPRCAVLAFHFSGITAAIAPQASTYIFIKAGCCIEPLQQERSKQVLTGARFYISI